MSLGSVPNERLRYRPAFRVPPAVLRAGFLRLGLVRVQFGRCGVLLPPHTTHLLDHRHTAGGLNESVCPIRQTRGHNDVDLAMITGPPGIRLVPCADLTLFSETIGGEHEVELPGGRGRQLVIRVVRGDVVLVRGSSSGHGSARRPAGACGAHEGQPQGAHSVEDRRIARGPVDASVIPIPVQDVEVTRRQNAVARLLPHKD